MRTIREQLEDMTADNFRALWNHYHRTVYPNDHEMLLTAIVDNPIEAVRSEALSDMVYNLYRKSYQPIANHHGIEVPYKYTQDEAVYRCGEGGIHTTWEACEHFCPNYHRCQIIYKLDRINVEYETGGDYE